MGVPTTTGMTTPATMDMAAEPSTLRRPVPSVPETMPLFDPAAAARPENRRLHAAYELVYTLVDFAAALLFVIGSVMFFSEQWQRAGTWMFLIGSGFFAFKPTIRLIREIHFLRRGRVEPLAERAEGAP